MALSEQILTLAGLEDYDLTSPDTGGQRRFCCPLPDCADKPIDSSHRSLSVATDTGAWYCHRCQNSGKLREFWDGAAGKGGKSKARRMVLPVALQSKQPMEVSEFDIEVARWQVTDVWKRSEFFGGTPGASYLYNKRGIHAQKALDAGVRYHASCHYRPAVLFPFYTPSNEMVAVNARFLDGDLPKAESRGKVSFGVFRTTPDIWRRPVLVVTEAPIDALSCAMAGYHSIALSGVRDAPYWLRRVLAWKTVILAFDSDTAGDKAASEWAESLPAFGGTTYRYRPSLKDCNEVLLKYGKEGLLRELKAVFALPAEPTNTEIAAPIVAVKPRTLLKEPAKRMTTVYDELKEREAERAVINMADYTIDTSDWGLN